MSEMESAIYAAAFATSIGETMGNQLPSVSSILAHDGEFDYRSILMEAARLADSHAKEVVRAWKELV